jgi:hypothetical protein
MELLAIISGGVSGACLLAILLKKKLPLWGTLASAEMQQSLSGSDKILASCAALAFGVCMAALVFSM